MCIYWLATFGLANEWMLSDNFHRIWSAFYRWKKNLAKLLRVDSVYGHIKNTQWLHRDMTRLQQASINIECTFFIIQQGATNCSAHRLNFVGYFNVCHIANIWTITIQKTSVDLLINNTIHSTLFNNMSTIRMCSSKNIWTSFVVHFIVAAAAIKWNQIIWLI